MCTAVRWCCGRLFLLSRRYPHGKHHARDIANTPETHQFVGSSSDTILASYLPHRDQTNPVDPLEEHQETVSSADHNIRKNRASNPKRGHRSSPKVSKRQKHKTKIIKFNSTRKAKIPKLDCLTRVETLTGTWVRHMASSRHLTTRQQMGGSSPYPHAVVRAAADRCRCYTAVSCPSKKNWGGGAKWKMYRPPYYCTSAGHHVLGKKCVFIAGSFLKKSAFKAGTTV